MWMSIVRFWLKWRTVFKILFFITLAMAVYLGMRASPTPAPQVWMSGFYHTSGMFALTVLSYLAFPRWYLWARGLSLFSLGGLIEYVQSFHPMRVADWADIQANGAGVAAGLVCIMLVRWWRGGRLL